MVMSPSPLQVTSGPDSAAAATARQVVRKAMWTKEEDRVLREQVRLHGGPHNWDAICAALPERNSKSCRLRWCQHLDPRVNNAAARPFTHQEDMLIVKHQATYGNRWSTIAEFLSGRTDNAVKNRWNSVLRKQSASELQGGRRQYRVTPSTAPHTAVTPGCLRLFPLESGDVRMDRRIPPPRQVSEYDETCAAPMDCLPLFPLAPGDIRANVGTAASNNMSCGAEDPLTLLSLAPAAPRMVFDVLPLAYRV